MRRKILVFLVLLFITSMSLSAVEGMFQFNTTYLQSTYPKFGTGGQGLLRASSVAFGVKSTRNVGLQGTADLLLLFPYKMEESSGTGETSDAIWFFSERESSAFSIGFDSIMGVGYLISLEPMAFFLSGGIHSNVLLEGLRVFAVFGLGFDTQVIVRLNKGWTAQTGFRFGADFIGVQTYSGGVHQFARPPITIGFYAGIGLEY